jgi:peptidoglycan/xylan/chitin deacetylase (PgdA/CDA1 family)
MLAWDYTPSRSAAAVLQRRLVQLRRVAPVHIAPDRPVVTFTFDDFPKSALAGADAVEAAGGRAGFYASTLFIGARHPLLGEMFDAPTLLELQARGHELGAQTHAHIDCARTPADAVERDVAANLVWFDEIGCTNTVSAFAWPYGETSYAAKKWAARVFTTARGISPELNVGIVDRTHLHAVELTDTAASRRRAIEMLKSCVATNAWLIFFTRDVRNSPSIHGVTPDLIAELANMARDEGASLLGPTLGAVLAGVSD